MLGVGLGLTTRRGSGLTRASFVSQTTTILGAAPALGWLPDGADTLTSTDPWTGKVLTADASMAGQITAKGRGYTRAFVTANVNYLTTPDAADLSFTTGAADQAVTWTAFLNVTDSAALRVILSKWNPGGSTSEWQFSIDAADHLKLFLFDQTNGVQTVRTTDAAISQGSWHHFAAVYDGRGGATAGDGVTLYQDGVALSSTAGNNAAYVCMRNTAAVVEVGSHSVHTVGLFGGGGSLVTVSPGAPSASAIANHAALCYSYFGA